MLTSLPIGQPVSYGVFPPAGLATCLFLSSMAASGPARNGRPSQEEDPPEPVSHYGRSKRAGELAVERCGDRSL